GPCNDCLQGGAALFEESHAEFPKTRWSLIDALRQGSPLEREKAIRSLAATYWPALYAFFRRSDVGRGQAAELTQAFFVQKVLEENLFEKAHEQRGSLR